MHEKGWRRETKTPRINPFAVDARKTTKRKVKTAENPNKQRTIQNDDPNATPSTIPGMMKASHRTQQKSERATVLRISKMISFFITRLLTTQSKNKVKTKRETPKKRPQINPANDGKRATVERPTKHMHRNPTVARVFLNDGRKKSDE
jgi:hypothetical protein